MKNTHIIGIISVTVLLLSTITIYGYESSGNKNINTYEATQESTPSVTTIPATTTPVTTNTTVSYTHLDVYKRQPPYLSCFLLLF